MDKIFKALSNKTRRQIVAHFSSCECNSYDVTKICDKFNLNQSKGSKDLRLLLEANILEVNQEHKRRFYSLTSEFRNEFKDILLKIVSEEKQWVCKC